MIKNNESKTKITNRNIKYYTDKKYKCSVGDIISIDVDTMSRMSHNIVIAICVICSSENEIPFSKYNKNKERQGFYSCKKCSNTKRKITNIIYHGVENIFQRSDVKENNRKWMSSEEFKIKSHISIKEKYGVDSYSKTDDFKKMVSKFNIDNKDSISQSRQKTCLEKYGYKSVLEIPNFKEGGMCVKYGASYSFHIPEIKKKIQDVNLERFGHISPLGNKDIQIKSMKKIFEIYGVDNIFKSDEFKKQVRDMRIVDYPNLDINLMIKYRRDVRNKTNRKRERFFMDWDGYDYYDNEFINDNLSMDFNDPRYPTIDHKISIFFGFINSVPIEEISSLENLCITKRIINLRKNKLIETEFKVKNK